MITAHCRTSKIAELPRVVRFWYWLCCTAQTFGVFERKGKKGPFYHPGDDLILADIQQQLQDKGQEFAALPGSNKIELVTVDMSNSEQTLSLTGPWLKKQTLTFFDG